MVKNAVINVSVCVRNKANACHSAKVRSVARYLNTSTSGFVTLAP
jgi:hypothetical protein